MTVQFRDKADTSRYAAAEDAFTSEGGHVALEDEAPGKDAATDRGSLQPASDFRTTIRRYSAQMHAVLAGFRRGGSRRAQRSANNSTR